MKKLTLLLLCQIFSLSQAAIAQNPGDLDQSFGVGGRVVTQQAPWTDITLQPDGKLLAVSSLIARFNTDGSLDATFSNDGVDTIKINDTVYRFNAIAIQPDGKILVAGGPAYNNNLRDFVVIRYNPDGSIDSSFDGDGVVRTDINSGSDDYAYALAIQADGKIVVAGASNTKLTLVRYHSDGSLDNTFDNDGMMVVNSINASSPSSSTHVVYMKIRADGKILAGSSTVLACFNPDGSLDNSFGMNGVATFSFTMNDLTIQPDGKPVLAGVGLGFKIIRLEANGSFDNSFGNSGIVTTAGQLGACGMFPEQLATSIALQPDGRILAGGYNMCGALNDCRNFVLIRYDPDGSLDSSFGSVGQVVTSFPQSFCENESHASVITPDLKIILAGHYYFPPDDGYMARYHLGWLLDVNSVSGNDGRFTVSPNPTFDQINIDAVDVENGLWHIDVRDITGRQLIQEDIVVTGGSINTDLSLKNLPAGIYTLHLNNGKEKTVSRVVKY